MFSSVALSALLLAPAANAFFIIGNGASTNQQRLDPITNPGSVSNHMHTIIGSDAFAADVDQAKLRAGSCTTGPLSADMSNYWAPQLYHRNDNNTYSAVPHLFTQVYYLMRGGPKTKLADIKAFPENYRVLAGNPTKTTFDATKHEDAAVSYVCLNYGQNVPVQAPTSNFPNGPCPDGVRAQIVFPSCWDGKNVDSEDHQSHAAYPIDAVDSGDCPATHPIKLPTMFHEWVYETSKFNSPADAFVWSPGYGEHSFHADFVNGWDNEVLQAAIQQCGDLNLFNDIEKCPPLAPFVKPKNSPACTIPVSVKEDVGFSKPLDALPGCRKDFKTGRAASNCDASTPAPAPAESGSSSSSAVSASSTSASAPAETYAPTSAVSSSTATAAATSSVSLPGGNLAVNPATSAIPATPTGIAPGKPKPTKTCQRSERAAEVLAEKRKRAVKHHVRRSLNRLSGTH